MRGISLCLAGFAAGALVVLAGASPAGNALSGWGAYGQLSPKQQRLLQAISAEYAGRLAALKAEYAAKRAELEARLAAPSVEPEAIDPLVEELNALRSEYFTERVSMLVDMRQNGLPFFGLEGFSLQGLSP